MRVDALCSQPIARRQRQWMSPPLVPREWYRVALGRSRGAGENLMAAGKQEKLFLWDLHVIALPRPVSGSCEATGSQARLSASHDCAAVVGNLPRAATL